MLLRERIILYTQQSFKELEAKEISKVPGDEWLPYFDIEAEIYATLAQQISDEIDQEILRATGVGPFK